MIKHRRTDVPATEVCMEGASDVDMRLLIGREHGAPNFSLRQFTVKPGGHTPRHSHDYEHEVIVISGSGRVEHGGEFHDIMEGDVMLIEPNVTHQFTNDGDGSLEFLCLVPATFNCGEQTPGS